MEKKIAFTIKDDIYDKFCLALNLSKEEEDRALETCLKWYFTKTAYSLAMKSHFRKYGNQMTGSGNHLM